MQELQMLQESLYYLHVAELKAWCEELNLSKKGKKIALIQRIFYFYKEGKRVVEPTYPKVSLAEPKGSTTLSPEALMLKGGYKNDLKTRLFFKKLIGEHFHFTAFGIDWLEEAWMKGKPPTYAAFAKMWEEEYALRKKGERKPKEEWAYICFVKKLLKEQPDSTKEEIFDAWHRERLRHKGQVDAMLSRKARVASPH